MQSHARSVATVLTSILITTQAVTAQCEPQWLPAGGIHGVGGHPSASISALTLWDADGNGPGTPQLVIGGRYRVAGDVGANCIASLDVASTQWTAMSEGISADSGLVPVQTLLPVAKPGGGFDLLVGGYFAGAGGTSVTNIARWDGAAWNPLGSGLSSQAMCAAALPDGSLVVGGSFTTAGGVPANCIARWDGSTWSALGPGFNNAVYDLGVMPNGDVIAGGGFTTSGGAPMARIAQWNGTTWSQLATGMNNSVRAIAVTPAGDVYAGGQFTTAGGNGRTCIARWDGVTWNALGSGLNGTVNDMALAPSGELFAVGAFTASGAVVAAANVARWDGAAWHGYGNGLAGIDATSAANTAANAVAVLPTGEVVVAGIFRIFAGVAVDNAAMWNGSAWQPLPAPPGDGMDGSVLALAQYQGGVIATGEFVAAGNAEARRVARHDGTRWVAMGTGLAGTVSTTRGQSVEVLPNGDAYVGGFFSLAGGVSAGDIARWDGVAWNNAGTVGDNLTGMTTLTDGTLGIASRSTGCVKRWNGTSWACISGTYGSVAVGITSVEAMPNGDLFVGGRIRYQQNVFNALNIGRWDGTQWDGSLKLDDPVHALLAAPNGTGGTDLYVCGEFNNATSPNAIPLSKIARWDGTQWHPLGSGLNYTARAMALAPDGSLIVGGDFTTAGGIPAYRIARWDGTQWHAMGGANAEVYSVAALPNGDVVIGGAFTMVDGHVSAYFARWGIPPGCAQCDTIDFNGDGLFPDTQDITDFISVFGGGVCTGQNPGDPPCNTDIDFNNDAMFPDTLDIVTLLRVFAGGSCAG